MKKLDKSTIAERDALANRFQAAFEDLDTAVTAYNEAITPVWDVLQQAMAAYNEVIDDANAWKNQIHQEIEDYMSGRSEKWQESPKAAEYREWQQAYEEDFEQVEIEEPQEIELGSMENHEELMNMLPEELGQQNW